MAKEKITDEVIEKEKTLDEMTDEEQKAYWNEPVDIKLFKDSNRYKDDLFVSVNGRTFQIKRGVKVTVPRNVAEVIKQSEDNEYENSILFEGMSTEFEEKAKKFK